MQHLERHARAPQFRTGRRGPGEAGRRSGLRTARLRSRSACTAVLQARATTGLARTPVYWHTELRRPGVTPEVLHLEYLERHPTGLRYTAFCDVYRRWLATASVTMRQVAQGWREVLRGLLGQDAELCRSADRSTSGGRAVRRCTRRIESHLRRGDPQPESAGLRDGARACARVLRRCAGDVGPGPVEERGGCRLPLRAGDPAHLRRFCSALRLGSGPGASAQAARQSQGRGGGAGGAALDSLRGSGTKSSSRSSR